MFTFQDYETYKNSGDIVQTIISHHRASLMFRTAIDADTYDHHTNSTITLYTKWLYTSGGERVRDDESANTKLCSDFFRRLNTQRNTYSLGNGVTFTDEKTKEKLGQDFDTRLNEAGYYALIHGISFIFWNVDHAHVFKLTEFAPLWDEETGALRAGLRYWRIDPAKPVMAVLYEEDGYTKFKSQSDSGEGGFAVIQEKRPYRLTISKAAVDAEPEIVGEENYSSLPIVPMYGSNLKQSTLVGMKAKIDSYDLIQSGFANDLQDCSEIYWIVSNAGGMDNRDLNRFRDRLKHQHIVNLMDADEVHVQPYTQQVPTAARATFLAEIRASIYEDFGGLDVHTIAAGATNDHIDAAYQPLDENADDFEYQIIQAVQDLLRLMDIEDTPIFKRNRISNQKEQADMVLASAQYLDQETVLKKLPFLSPDEVQGILDKIAEQQMQMLIAQQQAAAQSADGQTAQDEGTEQQGQEQAQSEEDGEDVDEGGEPD